MTDRDIRLEIDYAGICHSDIHQARGEWGPANYPMVPGHEIVGRVIEVGSSVTSFKVGDPVGVGVYVDSCRSCQACTSGNSHYCDQGMVGTYNAIERDGITPTYGGYSTDYVLDAEYAIPLPESMWRPETAPLLCAGITLYSPLRHWKVGPGTKVAVMGLGGLGHVGVKFAAALGAEVTVISHSESKREDAHRLGATEFIVFGKSENLFRKFDLMLNTISAEIDIEPYLQMLRINGTMVCIGLPGKPYSVSAGTLLSSRRALAGSMIGSVSECKEMIAFSESEGIGSDVEIISPDQINEAYERTVRSDVRYRFVIDIRSWRLSTQQ
jgi:uncharacterized zinc-type alcohol dehydrogenase-like protein